MEKKPLVSVIMNCFNGDTYLTEAINSVLNQTFENWEIIFWDNQSTDKSAQIVKSYNDSRIKYFYAPSHSLLYNARNLAISKSKGDFIAFLDTDDQWKEDKIKRQLTKFLDPQVGMACSNYWIQSEEKQKTWIAFKSSKPEGKIANKLVVDYYVAMSSLILRRSIISNLERPFNSNYQIIGDFDLVIRMALKHKIAWDSDPLLVYRWHKGSLSRKEYWRTAKELEDFKYNFMKDHQLSEDAILSINQNINYMNGFSALENMDRLSAIKYFRKLKLSKFKIRILIGLFLPHFLFIKIIKLIRG